MRNRIARILQGLVLLTLCAGVVFYGSNEPQVASSEIAVDLEKRAASATEALATHTDALSKQPVVVQTDFQWRPRPKAPLEEYPTTYAELRSLAENGDSHAVAHLSQLLFLCNFAPPPQSEEEIAAVVAEARRTHRLPVYYEPGTESLADFNDRLADLEANITGYEKRVRRCNSVSPEQRAELEDWLVFAKTLGATTGLLNLYQGVLTNEAYERFLDTTWHSGDPMALLQLAGHYYAEYLQGKNARGRILQHAHYLALTNLLRSFAQEQESSAPRELALVFDDMLEQQRWNMPAHEVREAEELAGEIVGSNSNCCLNFPRLLFSEGRN